MLVASAAKKKLIFLTEWVISPDRGKGQSREDQLMRKCARIICASTLSLLGVASALAQVTLDVTQLTCGQFVTYKVADPHHIALWISGYYHGTRSDPVIDTEELTAKKTKVEEYCFKNMDVPLLNAVEAVLGSEKK
jgi:hypothetical protein